MKLANKRDYSENCSVIVSLTQKVQKRGTEKSIGFRVYKIPKNLQKETTLKSHFIDNAVNLVDKSGSYINYREVKIFTSLEELFLILVLFNCR